MHEETPVDFQTAQPHAAQTEAAQPALDPAQLRALALEAGFTEAGLVPLPIPSAEIAEDRLEHFVTSGFHGQMDYLARRNDQQQLVRASLDRPFPWAQSVLLCLASYHSDAPHSLAPSSADSGWIARYAWTARRDPDGTRRPSDYHKVLLRRMKQIQSALARTHGDFQSRAYVDTGPLLERAAAHAAGLGWVGKNTCLIHPKHGSYTFLAALVLSLPVQDNAAPLTIPDRCGSCTRCLDACPTHALIAPRQMDATRCIAYLTIEHRGPIDPDLSADLGRQVFGCDICQDVCPWNRKAPIAHDDQLAQRGELVNPSLDWLASLDQPAFERLFNGSPIRRTGFWSLRRNLALAMGNSGLRRYLPWLQEQLLQAQLDHHPDAQSDTPALQPASKPASQPVSNARKDGFTQAVQWALNRLRTGESRD